MEFKIEIARAEDLPGLSDLVIRIFDAEIAPLYPEVGKSTFRDYMGAENLRTLQEKGVVTGGFCKLRW